MLEVGLVQAIFYLLLWLTSEYVATLITAIMVPILTGILIVSLLAELIERSKVPRKYFHFLIISIIIPVIIGLFFLVIYQGNFDWMQNI